MQTFSTCGPAPRIARGIWFLFAAWAPAAFAQFSTRISPDYAPDSIAIQVRESGLSRDGRWYFFFYENYPDRLQFFDVADNTRWEIPTGSFADIRPVGIATRTEGTGPHFFLFAARATAGAAEDGLWSMQMPGRTPVRISVNVSTGLPGAGVLAMIDQVALTPDESMVSYRAIYEFGGGARKPQAIQTFRFVDAAHFVSSQSPLSGDRRVSSYVHDPAGFRMAFVSQTFSGDFSRVFTSELALGVAHDLTPVGYEIVGGEDYVFNAEGHRLAFVAKRLPNTGDQDLEVWDSDWTGVEPPVRINSGTDLFSDSPRYAANGDLFYRTIPDTPPFRERLFRADIHYLDASQREIAILGRNQVSLSPASATRAVADFAVSSDGMFAAYRYEAPLGDAELHLAGRDGGLVSMLTPDTVPNVRIGDYSFSEDGRYLYFVNTVGAAPSGTTFATRVTVVSPAFPVVMAVMASYPVGTTVSLKRQGNHYVLSANSAGSFNRLYSIQQGTTRLQRWVEDMAESESEVIRPHLEPDGCGMFYVRRINGLVAEKTTGAQVWHARCAIQAFVPNAVGRYLQGHFQLDFQPRWGFHYRLFFSDRLEGSEGQSDWRLIPTFSTEKLPWTDTGQETGYLPEKGSRFFRVEAIPIPYSVEEPPN